MQTKFWFLILGLALLLGHPGAARAQVIVRGGYGYGSYGPPRRHHAPRYYGYAPGYYAPPVVYAPVYGPPPPPVVIVPAYPRSYYGPGYRGRGGYYRGGRRWH